ncbi:MAG: hypothetical protein EOO14_14115 [Chitinophagaceae bacterium]|nr:MAG: hypothetical protein EOO14_14115 [Chitinophagaceae bacterium]
MDRASLAIATITWARDKEEEILLGESLTALSRVGIPVFVTDGGSSPAHQEHVRSLPNVLLFEAKGLWAQAKKSLTEARLAGAKTILYTEPDKLDFFQQHLPTFLESSGWEKGRGVVLAARSATAFASFPAFQQMTERTINRCCAELTGLETDYLYGPFLFDAEILSHLDVLPETCGWGWRSFLFAKAHLLGYKLAEVDGDYFCPPAQRADDQTERVYRMKQLAQNIDGLVLAAGTHKAV